MLFGSYESARAAEPPTVHYWHIWTDDEGGTHQRRCTLRNFDLKSMKPQASPQWQDRLKTGRATVIVTVQPVGWRGTWHEDPKPQWIVPLSGRWFVETTDGKRTEMGPGELSFGEDKSTRADARGHKGHLSGTVGGEPAVLMVVQLEGAPTVNAPCHLR
jgi:hypothetical protein